MRSKALSFVKCTTRHRRHAATHMLAIMVSPEDRSQKPYALPVQIIPYIGMPEVTIRSLVNKVIKEMAVRNMPIAGMSVYIQFC